ncbi:MAG: O-antigen ligase family protein [Chakrabartia sp.]
MPRFADYARRGPQILLALFLIFTFALGGSARTAEPLIAELRALALVLVGAAFWTLRGEHMRAHKGVLLVGLAVILLVLLHLLPLPYEMWRHLPGRDLLAAIDQAAGLGSQWRPMSMSPAGSLDALMALSIPAAILLLGCQLTAAQHVQIAYLVLALMVVAMGFGLLQAAGFPLALYASQTPLGGAFANRNHQALFLAMLIPMAAALARLSPGGRTRQLDALGLGLCVIAVPLILVTGSRAGLGLALAAVVGVPLVLGPTMVRLAERTRQRLMAGAILLLLLLTAATIFAGRDVALDRLADSPEDLRWAVWRSLVPAIHMFFPWGAGIGSYVEAYQVVEPDFLLRPTFSNHAHNEVLEIAFTAGFPGLLLLGIYAGLVVARAIRQAGPQGAAIGRLGFVLILLIGLASLTDYPASTPIILALLALFSLWTSIGAGFSLAGRRKEGVS